MYKILAIMGQGGSGKDTLMKEILNTRSDLHEIISCTTRPIREGEAEGVNYFYFTPAQFEDKILHNEMLETSYFNDWFYGTSYESVRSDCINIGVFNPTGVRSLLARDDVDVKIVYVRADDKTRLLRQLNREEHPDVYEIVRRFKADWLDFENIAFNTLKVVNEKEEDLQDCVKTVNREIDRWVKTF